MHKYEILNLKMCGIKYMLKYAMQKKIIFVPKCE